MDQMILSLASSITKAASKQTYYTIQLLVDRDRVDDAFRAYAYFRWVDDVLDANSGLDTLLSNDKASERKAFIERQKSLLEKCYQGEVPRDTNLQERMLVELIHRDHEGNSGLQSYLRNMMLVMDFDTMRRGMLISQVELSQYTYWLASAVTEALHYFIGHDGIVPQDETRYMAVSAAHIIHMLRDTFDDIQAGYFNIPREVLGVNHINPQDVHSEAYRAWVRGRVGLAREYFEGGKDYFMQVQNTRYRLAGFAYMARFEWLLEKIEKEAFYLRPQYNESKNIGTGLRMSWLALSSMVKMKGVETPTRPVVSRSPGGP